jgi:hypothetical protein
LSTDASPGQTNRKVTQADNAAIRCTGTRCRLHLHNIVKFVFHLSPYPPGCVSESPPRFSGSSLDLLSWGVYNHLGVTVASSAAIEEFTPIVMKNISVKNLAGLNLTQFFQRVSYRL